jgi:hypothetical protein
MKRPEIISNEDILRWSENIDNDSRIPESIKKSAIMREVCYAGLWLAEQLEELKCPEDLIIRIQHAAGGLSFGRDIWETHQSVLESYKNDEMEFETELADMN